DVPHKLRGNRPLIFDVVHLMDEPLPLPKNQNLDEELYANRLSRVLKRRAKLEDELQERMCKD
ncbi:MAG TPA: hypothetical protein VNO70_22630, partial [Blastocatellia bacterium]|nr:hypothetical protein [Blastocatellia bacterium]